MRTEYVQPDEGSNDQEAAPVAVSGATTGLTETIPEAATEIPEATTEVATGITEATTEAAAESADTVAEAIPEAAPEITAKDKGMLAALIAFVAVTLICAIFLIGFFDNLNTEEGRQALVDEIRGHGFVGILILLGLQVIQVVVAIVPGEIVEIIGGMIYGPLWGSLIILVGVVLASAAIFALVRKLGHPFVSKVVSKKHLDRFSWLTDAKRLGLIVFLLFLCPGLPKDILSYIVPLTDMKMARYLVLATAGRTPGVVVLAFGGSSFLEGRYTTMLIIMGVAAVIAVVGILLRGKIMNLLEKRAKHM